MTYLKRAAIVAALAVGTAAVTAFAGVGPKPPTEAVSVANPADAACPQEPWPFGCQWREPMRRVFTSRRPS